MLRLLRVLAVLFVVRVHGQGVLYSLEGGIGDDSVTSNCGSTFEQANATGFFSLQPNVAQLPQDGQPDNDSGYTRPVELGVTVVSGGSNLSSSAVQWSIWYSTGGANYSDDIGLGYDVCAFTIGAVSTNTLYRGQTDTGNCMATFDSECVSALESAASGFADQLIADATPPPNSNLTADALSRVCYDVALSLQSNFPSQCEKYMNDTVQLGVGGYPLTDNSHSKLYNGCDLTTDKNTHDYHLLYTLNVQVPHDHFEAYYSVVNWELIPAMLTFLPVANWQAGQSISSSNSKMGCLHASNVTPGSVKPLTAPSPTPIGSKGLSGGAIAGIVVGAIAGVAIIAGAAFWFWRKRRAQRKQTAVEAATGDQPPAYADAKEQRTPMAEAPADLGIKELSPDSELRPELATHKSEMQAELSGEGKPGVKRSNTNDPVELFAPVPDGANPTYGR